MRLAYDAAGAAAAFRAAGRDYAHVLASPSSRPGLAGDLAGLGYRHVEDQVYRRTAGTGSGAPGLLALEGDDFEAFLEVWRDSWGADDKTDGREEAYRRRFRDPRSRPFRTGDGGGRPAAVRLRHHHPALPLRRAPLRPGAGVGRRMLELARGLVPAAGPCGCSPRPAGRPTGPRPAPAGTWTTPPPTGSSTLAHRGAASAPPTPN